MNIAIQEIKELRKRKHRLATGLTIVEGYPEISRAIKAGISLRTLYICPEIFISQTNEFDNINIVEVSKDVFKEMAFGQRLKGILAICRPRQYHFTDLKLNKKPLIVVLEGLEKPGNLGTVIRTADGAGVDAVIMCEGKTDVYNHNVVRSSTGTVFTVPTIAASKEETLNFLQQNQFNIYTASAKTKPLYTDINFTNATAIIIGSEHAGVSLFWKNFTDEHIRIPMRGDATCLNAAMSASIIIYEALRQRNLNCSENIMKKYTLR